MVAIAFGCGVFSKSLRNTNETFLYCKYHILYSSVSLVLSLIHAHVHAYAYYIFQLVSTADSVTMQTHLQHKPKPQWIMWSIFDHVPTKFIFNANHLLLFFIRNYDCRGNKKKQLKKSYTNLSKITVKHWYIPIFSKLATESSRRKQFSILISFYGSRVFDCIFQSEIYFFS